MNTFEDRFWSKVAKTDSCWIWQGAKSKGYGQIKHGDRLHYAHRASYEMAFGIIPDGLQIDHTCFARSCVKPAHLRLATPKQNNENLQGPLHSNKSGYRGVWWERGAWRVAVVHHGKSHNGGRYPDVHEAGAAAAALRSHLFTHNIERMAGA